MGIFQAVMKPAYRAAWVGVVIGAIAGLGAAPARAASAGVPQAQKVASAATGIAAGRLSVASLCRKPKPEQASCELRVVDVRATSRPASVHVDPVRSPSKLIVRRAAPQDRSHALGSALASGPAAQTAPLAGTPEWLQQAYDLTALSATRGSGKTGAIVDAWNNPDAQTDLNTFRAEFGLPACTVSDGCLEEVNQSGAPAPLPAAAPSADAGWRTEETLDLDAVSSICPNCHILYVEAGSQNLSDLQVAQSTAARLGASEISDSWSALASTAVTGAFSFPGIATVAAAGDDGTVTGGQFAYPAALAGVTAAGATTLTPGSVGARGYTETGWNKSGSGCATDESRPSWQSGLGCAGRAYNDVSADGDPDTGLMIHVTQDGGWEMAGGTSLAAPIIASFYALAAITDSTSAWAYEDAAKLNDVTLGDNGSCSVTLICGARAGYDGLTGNGSISGDVTAGPPGIAAPASVDNAYAVAISRTSATLRGAIYPNGLSTLYWLQYGTSTAYGAATSVAQIGAGSTASSVAVALSGLAAGRTYHYRLVAENADGTSYGYDQSLTTAAFAQAPLPNGNAAQVDGVAAAGQTLIAQEGQWLPLATPSYQWYLSTDGTSWTEVGGATGQTYKLPTDSHGDYVAFIETQTNADGAKAEASDVLGPVTGGTAPVTTTISGGSSTSGVSTTTASTSGVALVGFPILGSLLDLVSTTVNSLVGSTLTLTRCSLTCVKLSTKPQAADSDWDYAVTKADVGSYIVGKLKSPASDSALASTTTVGVIGPVTSPAAGATALRLGRAVAVKSQTGAALVQASAKRVTVHYLSIGARLIRVSLAQAKPGRSRIKAWVYVLRAGMPVGGRDGTFTSERKTFSVTLPAGCSLEVAVART